MIDTRGWTLGDGMNLACPICLHPRGLDDLATDGVLDGLDDGDMTTAACGHCGEDVEIRYSFSISVEARAPLSEKDTP